MIQHCFGKSVKIFSWTKVLAELDAKMGELEKKSISVISNFFKIPKILSLREKFTFLLKIESELGA